MSDKNPSHMRTTVVVTATRRDTELVTSPIAAGSVLRPEIDVRGSQTLDQTQNLTEGLYRWHAHLIIFLEDFYE